MLTKEEQLILKREMIEDEGYRNKIYSDTRGNATVGIGHLCSNGFSDAVIDLIYEEDWQKHYNFLNIRFPWFGDLNFPRKVALISMSFNLGESNFLGFRKVIKSLEHKDYVGAADGMRNSLWSRQVSNRVRKLSAIIETGKL